MSNYIGTNPAVVQLADPSLLITINAASTLNVQAYGKTFLATGSGGFATTLPPLSAGGFAGTIVVANDASTAVTVITTDAMRLNGASVTTVTILPGDSASFQNDASSWNVVSTSSKAPLVSPALTGNPTAPTQSLGDSSTKLATTAWTTGYVTNLNLAPKASPALTGTPTTPTNANPLDASNQVANDAFVQAAIQAGTVVSSSTGTYGSTTANWIVIRLPGGIQIATGSGWPVAIGGTTFTFPLAFRTGTQPNCVGIDAGNGNQIIGTTVLSNTQFRGVSGSTTGSFNTSSAINWTAIGFY